MEDILERTVGQKYAHKPDTLVSGVSEKIDLLVWPLVAALAYCLYAPELDIQ